MSDITKMNASERDIHFLQKRLKKISIFDRFATQNIRYFSWKNEC